MAYLEAGASLAAVMAAYEASSIYDVTEDLGLCREHIQACRILIGRTADETRQGSAALRNNAMKYATELEKAVAWLRSRDTSFAGAAGAGYVRQVSLEGMRE